MMITYEIVKYPLNNEPVCSWLTLFEQHHHPLAWNLAFHFICQVDGFFFFVSMVKQCTKRIHLKFKGYCLPADHPSTCWRILKNSAICAANFVLYHETAGMYPIVFGTYYIQSLVIHRLVTPVNERKEKKPWIFYRRIHCVKVQLKFLTNE